MVARLFCAFQCAVATVVYGGDPVSLTSALDTLAPSVSNVSSLVSGDEHRKVVLKTASKTRRKKKSMPRLVPIHHVQEFPEEAPDIRPKNHGVSDLSVWKSFALKVTNVSTPDALGFLAREAYLDLFKALSLGLPCYSFPYHPMQREFYAALVGVGGAFFMPNLLISFRDIPKEVQKILDNTQPAFDLLMLSKRARPIQWDTEVLSLDASREESFTVNAPVLPSEILTPTILAYENFLKVSREFLNALPGGGGVYSERLASAHSNLLTKLADLKSALSDAQDEDLFNSFKIVHFFWKSACDAHAKFLASTSLKRRKDLYSLMMKPRSHRPTFKENSPDHGSLMEVCLLGKLKKIKATLEAMETNLFGVNEPFSTFYVAKKHMTTVQLKKFFMGKRAADIARMQEVFHCISLENISTDGQALSCPQIKQWMQEHLNHEVNVCEQDIASLDKIDVWEKTSLYKDVWMSLKPLLSVQGGHYLRETLVAYEVLMDTLGAPFGVNLIPVEELLIKDDPLCGC
jgi:hypothetical protein